MSCFRTCLTCRSRSQPGLCHCTRAPPLQFRRRPPQSNYPSTNVPEPDDGPRLESQNEQGGISPLAPPSPRARIQSLPPILRSPTHNPLIECSKGARGLSVLSRASGVFTGTTSSPGSFCRQSQDRYAIRAGRNLPDKEFRYLRTVIVTAAVHRGFSLQLRLL